MKLKYIYIIQDKGFHVGVELGKTNDLKRSMAEAERRNYHPLIAWEVTDADYVEKAFKEEFFDIRLAHNDIKWAQNFFINTFWLARFSKFVAAQKTFFVKEIFKNEVLCMSDEEALARYGTSEDDDYKDEAYWAEDEENRRKMLEKDALEYVPKDYGVEFKYREFEGEYDNQEGYEGFLFDDEDDYELDFECDEEDYEDEDYEEDDED